MKSVSGASIIRLEMIQGDNLCDDDDGCLSPEWEEWMDDYRSGRSRYVRSHAWCIASNSALL